MDLTQILKLIPLLKDSYEAVKKLRTAQNNDEREVELVRLAKNLDKARELGFTAEDLVNIYLMVQTELK